MALTLSGGHMRSVLCVDVQMNGDLIASGAEDGELCLWSTGGVLVHKFDQISTDCTSVCFSTEKPNLIYASFGKKISVFDLSNLQQPLETFEFNEDEINQIQFDEKEHYLAACDDSGEIKIIGLQDKKLFKSLRNKHSNICSTLCFHPRRPWDIMTGGMDCKLIHWDFSRPKCLNQFNMEELQDTPATDVEAYMVNPPFIHHLSASPDGKYLAGALENGAVVIFDTSRRNISQLFSLHAHMQGTSQVHFISDCILVSGGNDCNINIWNVNNAFDDGDNVQTLPANGHTGPQDSQNATVTQKCKMYQIPHTSKINWLRPFRRNGEHFLAIADQTAQVTILPMNI